MTSKDIDELKKENQHLHLKLAETQGQLCTMSMTVDKLYQKCEDLQVRSMNRNIVIHNIRELPGEDIYETVSDFLQNKLKIAAEYVHSQHNPVAPVQVDIAHRIGRPGTKGRPIVVQLVQHCLKDVIFAHVKNLKGSGIFVSVQLPSELRGRSDVQFSKFKKLKEDYQ